MALARIRTNFPEEVIELCEALREAGYSIETLRPDEFRIAPADLELTVEKLPVVDAWRHIPQAEVMYIAPGTPESGDIRGAFRAASSREPWFVRIITEAGEFYRDLSRWTAQQAREVRSRIHEAREHWTPPREYHAEIHLEPAAPSTVDPPAEPKEMKIDPAIEQLRLKQEELRLRQEEEQRELQENARLAEENRRRAREAAEAKALLEERKKIEAMVRATQMLHEQVVVANLPLPREVERRKPRHLLRTRRERAFARAGIAAFTLSLGLALIAGEALHPRAVSRVVPQHTVSVESAPFSNRQTTTPVSIEPQNVSIAPASVVSSFPAIRPTEGLQRSGSKPSAARHTNPDGLISEDEVIVRHPTMTRSKTSKSKSRIAHYSDLD